MFDARRRRGALVKDSGNIVEAAYNLHGDLIQKRNQADNCCSPAPHFSTTGPDGCGCWTDIMDGGAATEPEWAGAAAEIESHDAFSRRTSASTVISAQADWVMMSLCSAHLEEKHQWGAGVGVEDDLFLTNEEWTSYKDGAPSPGIPGHAIELATMRMYAVGVFTLGGFEKIVEVNCGHPDYVCFSPSGYNARRPRPRDGSARNIDAPRPAAGNFGTSDPTNKSALGARPDGSPYVWPKYVVPNRLYVGKGFNAQGQPASDFLSRNGLAYGQVYGFAMVTWPSAAFTVFDVLRWCPRPSRWRSCRSPSVFVRSRNNTSGARRTACTRFMRSWAALMPSCAGTVLTRTGSVFVVFVSICLFLDAEYAGLVPVTLVALGCCC